ncbi:hypothetical protein AgCh_008138 [Apium graveolens]
MENIVGYEVVSLESYYRSEQVKDFKYEDLSSLDLTLLSKDSPICIPAEQFLTLRAFNAPPIVLALAAIVIVSFWHIKELVMNLVVSMILGLLDVFCGWNL